MTSPVKSPRQKAGKKACVFCGESRQDEDMFGKLLTKAGIRAHYFCMLFSSGLSQNGKSEKEGILGFLVADITKEVKRASRLRCSYCKKQGATIGCVMKNCKKSFHLGCGRRNNTLHQFFDTFCSYCQAHRPQQEVVASDDSNLTCSICMSHVNAVPCVESIQAPCCKKYWYHRDCIQTYSNSAGLYFFKCPMCNNKEDFQLTMLTYGIYIPDQDASWETEPNAYQELLERYRNCDASVCKCAEGRQYDKDGTKWELKLCEMCGSQGSHIACNYLVKYRKKDTCPSCYSVERKVQMEKKTKSPKGKRSPEMPLLEPEDAKTTGSSYPGPTNKIRKKGLPCQNYTFQDMPCPVLSPQEMKSIMSPRMKMTPKSQSVNGKTKKKNLSFGGAVSNICGETKKRKTKCETQTYEMFKSELHSHDRNNKATSKANGKKRSLDVNSFVKKEHRTCKEKLNGNKESDTAKDYRNMLVGNSKLVSPGLSGEKKKYKKKKSVENDCSQSSITKWFKIKPQSDDERASSEERFSVKSFRCGSTGPENVGGTMSNSNYLVKNETKISVKRPKTVEWKGKQLIIKSPRVMLRKDTRLGKLKPRNLTIDMNDRKGEAFGSEQDFLTLLDTDVRVTRNMIQNGDRASLDNGTASAESRKKVHKYYRNDKTKDDNDQKQKLNMVNVCDSPAKNLRKREAAHTNIDGCLDPLFDRATDILQTPDVAPSSGDCSKTAVHSEDAEAGRNISKKTIDKLTVCDSPAKNLRKREAASLSTNDAIEIQEGKQAIDIENGTTSQMKSYTLLNYDGRLNISDSPAKNLRKQIQAKLTTDSPIALPGHSNKRMTELREVGPKNGEITPTSQVQIAFDFSGETVNKMSPVAQDIGITKSTPVRKGMKLAETCNYHIPEDRPSKHVEEILGKSALSTSVFYTNSTDTCSSGTDTAEEFEPSTETPSPLNVVGSLSASPSVRSSPRLKSKTADKQDDLCTSSQTADVVAGLNQSMMNNKDKISPCRSKQLFLDENMNFSPFRKIATEQKSDSDSPIFRREPVSLTCVHRSMTCPKNQETSGSGPPAENEMIQDKPNVTENDGILTRMKRRFRHSISSDVITSRISSNDDEWDRMALSTYTSKLKSKTDRNVKSGAQEEEPDYKTRVAAESGAKDSDSYTEKCELESRNILSSSDYTAGCQIENDVVASQRAAKQIEQNRKGLSFGTHDICSKIKLIEMQGRSQKILRQRNRNSLQNKTDEKITWTLPGTRQLEGRNTLTDFDKKVERLMEKSKPSPHLLEDLLALPEQDITKSNISSRLRRSSLPLKKRKFISAKLEANSEIKDFLGKSKSIFHNEPLSLSHTCSEYSDVSSASDECSTGLSLSPSYVTKFRRSHSKTDSDMSVLVVPNLSTFKTDGNRGSTKASHDQRDLAPGKIVQDCKSDIKVMSDYYSSESPRKKRRRWESDTHDDSDVIPLNPLKENCILID